MLRLEILIKDSSKNVILDAFVERLFMTIQQEISFKANRKKYQIREPYILKMNFIKWRDKAPDHIDLFYYITRCLVLNKERSRYVIELNSRNLVVGSQTLVKDLIRLLEYGNEVLQAYPLIRDILSYYQKHWEDEFDNIVDRTLF